MPQVDVKLVSTADTSGAERMKTTLEGVGGSAKNAASGAGMFAGKMGEASIKAAAGKDVIEGLSMAAKGGEQSFFGATKALGSFMAVLSSGPVMGFVSALGLALAAFKLFCDRVAEATEKHRSFGEEINGTKEDYAALASAAAKSLDTQIEKIKEATSALKEYSEAAERAANRAKEIEDASARLAAAKLSEAEQGELAKAKTPEERAAIKARYDEKRVAIKAETEKNNLLNDRLAAEGENKKYQERLDEISGIRTSADADVAVKQKAFDDWSSTASEYLKTYGLGSPQYSRALKNANMAKAELDTSHATRKTIYEQSDPEVSGIEKKMYKNKARIESSNKNMEALEIERRVAVKEKQSRPPTDEDKAAYEALIAKLNKQAEEAMLAGKFSGEGSQDEAVAAIAKAKADWAKKYGTSHTATTKRAPAATTPGGTSDGKTSAAPSAQSDLAQPLTDAAKAHEDAAKQSGESAQAAAEAAEKLKESAKPLDAAPLTSALQAAATAQQAAGAQSVAALQSLTTTASQLTQIAQQQSRQIETLRSQVAQVAQQVTNLRSAQNAAA